MEKQGKTITSLDPGFGIGLYTWEEAAGLLQTTAPIAEARLRQCILFGTPKPDFVLTFRYLIELCVIGIMLRNGVSALRILSARDSLKRKLACDHPLACNRLPDNSRLLLLAKCPFPEPAALGIWSLLRNLDFGEDGLADRWYPLGRHQPVMLDRRISYGAPIVKSRAIRTEGIADVFEAERDPDLVADWYDIPREEVMAAVDFEARRWRVQSDPRELAALSLI